MGQFDAQVNVSGAWKDVEDVKVNVNGAWKTVEDIFVKANNNWYSIKKGPTIDTGVYTISWTESSTSNNITWADDAASMTEADRLAKIKEHCHFAVVQWDATAQKPKVNYWLYDDNLNYRATDETGKVSSGVASDLTGTDGDVMMLYETVFWKVTDSGSGTNRQISISFTWDQSKTDNTWVSPHHYGDTLDSTTYAKYVGLGVFEGYVQSSQLRSINTSSQPTATTTQNNFYNAAIYNRNWQYNNQLPMTYAWYVMQLYFVKGNRDVQTAYGNGIVGGSKSAVNLNWSATNAWNNGTTANQTTGVTALGIQNAWGNVYKFMGETRYDNKVYRFTTLGGKDHNNIESGYASTWKSVTVSNTITGYNITKIMGTPEYPFFPAAGSGSTYSQYYGDYGYQSTLTARCVYVGGHYDGGLAAGALYVYANGTRSASDDLHGARLHVLIT